MFPFDWIGFIASCGLFIWIQTVGKHVAQLVGFLVGNGRLDGARPSKLPRPSFRRTLCLLYMKSQLLLLP